MIEQRAANIPAMATTFPLPTEPAVEKDFLDFLDELGDEVLDLLFTSFREKGALANRQGPNRQDHLARVTAILISRSTFQAKSLLTA